MTDSEEAERKESGETETIPAAEGSVTYGSMSVFIRSPEGQPVLLGTFRAPFLFIQQFTGDYEKFLCEGKPLAGRLLSQHEDGFRRYLVIAFKDICYLY